MNFTFEDGFDIFQVLRGHSHSQAWSISTSPQEALSLPDADHKPHGRSPVTHLCTDGVLYRVAFRNWPLSRRVMFGSPLILQQDLYC